MRMSAAVRWVGAVALLALAGFCAFGFLATFELMPSSTRVAWHAVYGIAGAACLLGAGWLVWPRQRG